VSSKKSGSVLSKMCTANKVLIEKNRKYISQLIDIVLYLSKQGIALEVTKNHLNQQIKVIHFNTFHFKIKLLI